MPQSTALNVTLSPISSTLKALYSQVPPMEVSDRDVVSKDFTFREEPVNRQTPVEEQMMFEDENSNRFECYNEWQ